MQENDPFVTVTTDIAAPPETVWRVLTEFSRYADWHLTLSFDGEAPELKPGAQLALRLSGGVAGDQAFIAELTQITPPHLLAWQGGVADVFFGRHTFELQALPGGGTRFTDTERWSGAMAASVVAEHRAALEKEYARSAAALKEQAERRCASPR
jgi:hypothetical protein